MTIEQIKSLPEAAERKELVLSDTDIRRLRCLERASYNNRLIEKFKREIAEGVAVDGLTMRLAWIRELSRSNARLGDALDRGLV